MKKALLLSGVLTALLLSLLVTGWADTDDAVKEALRSGNAHYEAGEYAEALAAYEAGLERSPQNPALNHNAAQAALWLGEYQKALDHYEKAGDSTERFLNAGNLYALAGDAAASEAAAGGAASGDPASGDPAAGDPTAGDAAAQSVQLYAQALAIYKEGIEKFPENVPLKFNYEYVLAKLEAAQQEMEQQSGEQGEEGEEGEEQEQQSAEGSGDSQEDQGEQGDQEQQESQQEQESEGTEDSDDSQESQDSQEQQESGEEQSQQQASASEGEESAPDQEAIARILQMLEAQEEESLKNNREVIGGNEANNGW